MNKNFNYCPTKTALLLLIILFFISKNIFPQLKEATSSEIYSAIEKLNVLGSVLYIAAHPDDENNAVLTYMSKGKLLHTGYLSLTRGDGGQNLLGNEKGDLLGVIRTQELLAARRIDGAEQFFTRAIDFGYSKTPEETLNNWDREVILGDIVKVIRKFKPDIIITRFSKTRGGHGHHLASAILAEEAFFAAADPSRFPEQLKDVEIWQAKRIVWDTFNASSNAVLIDVGDYNTLLGKSYNEIAGASRSMHKTQGFGVAPSRGTQTALFEHTSGDTAKNNLFENIDLTWNRITNSNKIQNLINRIQVSYKYEKPEMIVNNLVELYEELDKNDDKFWIPIKKKEVKELIRLCSGLWLEAVVWQPGVSPGQNIDIRSMILNRSEIPMQVEKIGFTYSSQDSVMNKILEDNKSCSIKSTLKIPADAPYTQAYWLQENNNGKMFVTPDDKQIGLAENPHAVTAHFYIKINENIFQYDIPVLYRWIDAVEGENFRPFVIRPQLSLKVEEATYVFPDEKPREITVHIEAKDKNAKGKLSAVIPEGWDIEPKFYPFELINEGDFAAFIFKVISTPNAKNGDLKFKAVIDEKEFTNQLIEIDYSHIPIQTVLTEAKAKLVKLNITVIPKSIGYVMGSGDDIPVALKQLGYKVDLLSDDDLDNKNLKEYDVIITGVRAFNTRENLDRQQKRLNEFVEEGGTWIAQHNTRFGIQVPQIGPYPFPVAGRDRVAEENAKVQILIPDHEIFNYPNKISNADFDGWVQERGVNLADNWGGKLYPLLSCSDTGEPAKLGGLLYSTYGKGVFIYTAYSWFRQLPAGVQGAYRLFVNIISAGENNY